MFFAASQKDVPPELLKKWDVKRNIERDQIYKQLTVKRKEDLLSQIAYTTSKASNYFFKRREVRNEIEETLLLPTLEL